MHGQSENGSHLTSEDIVGLRGEFRGIDLFARYPSILVDDLDAAVDARLKEEKDNVPENE
jgi:hypothetical protein